MDINKTYYDSEGNERTIMEMIMREPEWAANRLQEGEKAIERLKGAEDKDHEIAFLYRTLEKLANETLEVNKDGSFYGSTTAVDVNKALGLWK